MPSKHARFLVRGEVRQRTRELTPKRLRPSSFSKPLGKELEEAQIENYWRLAKLLLNGGSQRIWGKRVTDRGVIKRTPRSPLLTRQGTTANEWRASLGRNVSRDTSPPKRQNRKKKDVPRPNTLKTITVSNPTMAAVALEVGLYPVPVKRGTWIPHERRFEIRSEGGFSKRAPGGIMGPAVRNIRRQVGR